MCVERAIHEIKFPQLPCMRPLTEEEKQTEEYKKQQKEIESLLPKEVQFIIPEEEEELDIVEYRITVKYVAD